VGIDLVVLGRRPGADGHRVVTLDDPASGRHAALVLSGDRPVGATCLGMPSVAAELSVMLERRTPLPADPLALLLPERRTEEASPVRMPGTTTVCRCNDVSKQDVVDAWEGGARTVETVTAATRATTGCGGCAAVVCGLVDWLREADPEAQPLPRSQSEAHSDVQADVETSAQFARP
jgi:assimilatory nitrate reductase electron transfer subunit